MFSSGIQQLNSDYQTCDNSSIMRLDASYTLARAGVPLTKVSKALGHGSLRTTQIYLRFTPDEGADVTSRLPDLGAASAPP